ncbi:methyltransferase [Haloarchaeobius sp. DFWS5]|uniref:methyltransferase n=1 Tax=Haloarchaeobius sp. DFWS5 TaxID=3446114 RepID=UPI003EBF40CB
MTRTPDDLALEARVDAGPATYRFATADGLCSTDSFRPSELALLDALWDEELGHLCCLEANYGVVPTVLAAQADAVHATETSARAVRLCERNSRANDADAAVSLCADLTTPNTTFDTIAYAPKPYTPISLGKQRIADALTTLRPGGQCVVAGSTDTGLTRYETCLQDIAAQVETVTTNGGARVLRATRPTTLDTPAYVSPTERRATVDGTDLTLVTMPGLFSAGGLDDGTRLLLKTVTVEDGERVLDLCCGYGAVGAYAGAVADCSLWLSDDDALATTCARRTLRASNAEGTVVTGDCLARVRDQRFDRVLCNPPTHAGDGVLTDLFAGIEAVLAPDGDCFLVHHRDLDLRPHLHQFGTVERRRTGAEHVVLRVAP